MKVQRLEKDAVKKSTIARRYLDLQRLRDEVRKAESSRRTRAEADQVEAAGAPR